MRICKLDPKLKEYIYDNFFYATVQSVDVDRCRGKVEIFYKMGIEKVDTFFITLEMSIGYYDDEEEDYDKLAFDLIHCRLYDLREGWIDDADFMGESAFSNEELIELFEQRDEEKKIKKRGH